jgi:hypothetical protein
MCLLLRKNPVILEGIVLSLGYNSVNLQLVDYDVERELFYQDFR